MSSNNVASGIMDRNSAKLRKELWGNCFDDLGLDGLRLLTHWVSGYGAFQSVAKY